MNNLSDEFLRLRDEYSTERAKLLPKGTRVLVQGTIEDTLNENGDVFVSTAHGSFEANILFLERQESVTEWLIAYNRQPDKNKYCWADCLIQPTFGTANGFVCSVYSQLEGLYITVNLADFQPLELRYREKWQILLEIIGELDKEYICHIRNNHHLKVDKTKVEVIER